MKTMFERHLDGCQGFALSKSAVPTVDFAGARQGLDWPQMTEGEVARHYTALSGRAFGVDTGSYPLGSCTMKYNPKLNERLSALPGFARLHPTADDGDAAGTLEALWLLQERLGDISGMDAVSLQPCAGAHGEWTALMMVAAYHAERNDAARKVVLVPESAHGTNPASAAMAGFDVRPVKCSEQGHVDLEDLRAKVAPDVAALMLTNPSTLGLFEPNITQIADIVHGCGGVMYYDGANLNAIMGVCRPGDMGFDLVHFNLHKTFGTPHGGGGPGSGPVGCKAAFAHLLPTPHIVKGEQGFARVEAQGSIGKVSAFHGNITVCLKALCYILMLGQHGLREAAVQAVLNANYLQHQMRQHLGLDKAGWCMHEFVLSAKGLKDETGVSALDLAKGMLDAGMHPPTMYFPLIVPEALMFEPTETESVESLDNMVDILVTLWQKAHDDPQALRAAPVTTPIGRVDEIGAARNPVVIEG